MSYGFEVVNVVGAGNFNRELDLNAISIDIDIDQADFNPKSNALFIRFSDDNPLCVLFASGKYSIRGGKSVGCTYDSRDKLLQKLSSLDINVNNETFQIRNIVCIGDVETEIDLERFINVDGLENTQYEPEQFPGVVYRSEEPNGTALVFNSGKIVITGLADKEAINRLFHQILQSVSKIS